MSTVSKPLSTQSVPATLHIATTAAAHAICNHRCSDDTPNDNDIVCAPRQLPHSQPAAPSCGGVGDHPPPPGSVVFVLVGMEFPSFVVLVLSTVRTYVHSSTPTQSKKQNNERRTFSAFVCLPCVLHALCVCLVSSVRFVCASCVCFVCASCVRCSCFVLCVRSCLLYTSPSPRDRG